MGETIESAAIAAEALRVRVADHPPLPLEEERHILTCPAAGCTLMQLTRQRIDLSEHEFERFRVDNAACIKELFSKLDSLNNRILATLASVVVSAGVAILIYLLGK